MGPVYGAVLPQPENRMGSDEGLQQLQRSPECDHPLYHGLLQQYPTSLV